MAERILVVRLSAIGDIVMASGLATALRARYPDAHIAWLAEPAGASLLQRNTDLDEVIVLDRPHWKRLRAERRYGRLAAEFRSMVQRLRAGRYSIALDAQGLLKSAIWVRASGAPRRIGLGSREGSARLMTQVLTVDRDDDTMASEYRRLAAHLDAPADAFRMRVATDAADATAAREALTNAGIHGGYAVICPFTTRAQKHWFDDHWVTLAEGLRARTGLPTVVLGGPDDRAHAARLVEGGSGAIKSLAGAFGLRAAAAVIAGSRAVVGVDTGLTHMGTAARVPTIALFGSTRPYLRTDSPCTRVLYQPLWCSPCRRNPICGGEYSCMRLLRPEAVLETAIDLLEEAA